MRYLVGGDKGGIGKDAIASGLYHAAMLAGVSPLPLLIELETSQRLGLIYPEAVTIAVDVPSPETLYADPDTVYAALDRAAGYWSGPGVSITSLGANVTSGVLAWSAQNGLGAQVLNNTDTTFIISLTMNRHALSAGLSNLYEIGQTLPEARRVAILNDVHASFMVDDKFLAKRLEEARGDGKPIDTMRLPRCSAPAWGYAQNIGNLEQIANLDASELIAMGLPEGPVRRSMPIIASWISDSLIAPLAQLLPSSEKPKSKRAK
jgi:hypothetical protein